MWSRQFVLASALFAPTVVAQDVLVVDKNHAPGWEYSTIQTAVDAAQDGDIVLVRVGTYYDESLKIISKGITVTADVEYSVKLTEGVTIQGLLEGQTVVLRGLRLEPDTWWANDDKYGLRASTCAGAIRLVECTLIANHKGGKLGGSGFDGLIATDCASLVAVNCTVQGGTANSYGGGSGGHGLRSTDSRIMAFGCTFTGNTAYGSAYPYELDFGGDGALIDGGWLYAAGCVFHGGDSFETCNGGHSISAQTADLVLLDPTYESAACGAPTSLVDCTLLDLPGPRRTLFLSSPVREGQTLQLYVFGHPLEPILLLVSLGTEDAFAPWLQAPLLVPVVPALLAPLGTTNHWGYFGMTFTVSPLPASLQGATLFCQAAFASSSGPKLSNATSVVVLDGSL